MIGHTVILSNFGVWSLPQGAHRVEWTDNMVKVNYPKLDTANQPGQLV